MIQKNDTKIPYSIRTEQVNVWLLFFMQNIVSDRGANKFIRILLNMCTCTCTVVIRVHTYIVSLHLLFREIMFNGRDGKKRIRFWTHKYTDEKRENTSNRQVVLSTTRLVGKISSKMKSTAFKAEHEKTE